ncbi:iron chelate uptake ABC transporter family permease subunit, partial [Mycobacterium tuberculosis]|nr:iron chelate uptake ABC transporter family permease subunit [Mycobacterium tuberculosis]
LSVTLLVGGATALVGSLGFVGLVAPHIARGIVGPAHGRLLPLSAVLGAALVLAADVLGRLLVAPAELPVGIVLGIIGGRRIQTGVDRGRRNHQTRLHRL